MRPSALEPIELMYIQIVKRIRTRNALGAPIMLLSIPPFFLPLTTGGACAQGASTGVEAFADLPINHKPDHAHQIL